MEWTDIHKILNEWKDIEPMTLIEIVFIISVCVMLISAVNLVVCRTRRQEWQSFFIGLGMAAVAFVTAVWFKNAVKNGYMVAACIGIQIPVMGGLLLAGIFKLLKRIFCGEQVKDKKDR